MAGSTPPWDLPEAATRPGSPRNKHRRWAWLPSLGLLLACVPCWAPSSARARNESNRLRIGQGGRGEANTATRLVTYFQELLKDGDIDSFRSRVAARYTEESLCEILAHSPVVSSRRASAVSLGFLGEFPGSNAVLGRALRDGDPIVRQLAEGALWSVWFRAGTPEDNRTLGEVTKLIKDGQLNQAEALASRLIVAAPRFAEAYNQRAIIYFHQNRFAESALDCQRVLSRNPYHFGAIGGLVQCQLEMNHPAEALKTLRRGLKIQPYSEGLRNNIKVVEAQIEPEGSH
jgi:tetratricopeptide (TPR) repeat protein